ncbi:uncharacterized protein LOC121726057 isoform X2 [Aricia agestis]|uniref:uncharacterized protein LOC121726057 isoform X2 n=1 Tax=Aricia agestis TaxID=91739 RepID=UPI001C203B38|nr:uncharacterized protein LOC121726057 isoform X2 [Aricia agestis]
MNQLDQNINKDMIDSDLIDVESLEFSDDQTWLYTTPNDSGHKVDVVEYNLACDWPINEDEEYLKTEKELYTLLDSLLKDEVALPDRHKFDSRTYVKPKRRVQRPSIQSIVEVSSNPPSLSPNPLSQGNRYLTYNKYNNPLAVSPMLRLKTFNVDTNTDNSNAIKEYASKRRSIAPDDDPQLEDMEVTLVSADNSARLSAEHTFKPINIDLSQPAHNLHHTFNKGMMNMMHESGSLNMYQSGESLMRMSPPSLVSSLVMEHSGNFNAESMESRKSLHSHKDSGLPASGRESMDPNMMTSMTLSILDEKDMSTSFLSQTTYPDNDSLMDSLPPSLVSSVNSSYIVSSHSKLKPEQPETNIFSSTTFTHLEQSEKLLSARPRCQLFNSFKRDSLKNSETDVKVLNENCDSNLAQQSKLTPKAKLNGDMSETVTLHYSNNKYKLDNDAEKENLNATFEADDAFYKDMGVQKGVDPGKNSLNITLDKQELNEIIQARQKLSLARKALPNEPPPNQDAQVKTIQLPNQTITVPRKTMENVSELLSRRRAVNYERNEEKVRETPKRNATFKKVSPKSNAMDATVVYMKPDENNIIDINSATLNLIDSAEKVTHDEWGLQERAMVGSSESTDTATFSSSSPPDSVPEPNIDPRNQIASTPLILKAGAKANLLDLHNTISPIYDMDDKSYVLTKAASVDSEMERTYDMNTTVINSATIRKSSAKRDILAGRSSPEKKPVQTIKSPTRAYPGHAGTISAMPPPNAVPRRTGLPTSKLRQYSSHKELNRIPAPVSSASRTLVGRPMVRRGVYASNPALSPTAPERPVSQLLQPQRRDSYTVAAHKEPEAPKPVPPLVRQGTETLRRERTSTNPPSRDHRASGAGYGLASQRSHLSIPSATRPYSIAGTSQLRISRPSSAAPVQRPPPVQTEQPRPSTERMSALPRPSRLPAPRRALRPPSVYSVAPTADVDHY